MIHFRHILLAVACLGNSGSGKSDAPFDVVVPNLLIHSDSVRIYTYDKLSEVKVDETLVRRRPSSTKLLICGNSCLTILTSNNKIPNMSSVIEVSKCTGDVDAVMDLMKGRRYIGTIIFMSAGHCLKIDERFFYTANSVDLFI